LRFEETLKAVFEEKAEELSPEHRRLLKAVWERGDPEAYQELLASDFFDQLYRTSSGHIGLGLFQ